MGILKLDGSLFGEGQPCFGCAPDHPIGFRLSFERQGEEVVTHFTPGERYQGPPGIMHGGLVMTLADEIAAWTLVGLRERFGFTTKVEGRLKAAVRTGTPVVGRGRIAADKRRMFDIHVEISQGDALCFEGEFRFVVLDQKGAERLLGGPLPEAWKRFGR
ncbi:MAG: PaaI family thioesterase [Myxococcota bacterium]